QVAAEGPDQPGRAGGRAPARHPQRARTPRPRAPARAPARGRPWPVVAPAGEAGCASRDRAGASRLAPDADLHRRLALHRGAGLARERLAESRLVRERAVYAPLAGGVRLAG